MHFLYGLKGDGTRHLVATFGSEEQLLAYVRWATLEHLGGHRRKFEQGSVLAGYGSWESSPKPVTDEDATAVVHNPSPNML